jgi:hypothetical protein
MRGSFIATVITLWLLAFSCGDDTYRIPKKDRPFFEDGDTLLFKTSSRDTDSLIVSLSFQFEQHDKGDSYEYADITYRLIKNKVIDNSPLMYIRQWIDGATIFNTVTPSQTLDQLQLSSGAVIKGVAEYENSPQFIAPEDIDLIYHKAYYGVIKYRYHNGESYELQLH